jgi:hypothetical protein
MSSTTALSNTHFYKQANQLYSGMYVLHKSLDYRINELTEAFPDTVGRDILDSKAIVGGFPKLHQKMKRADAKFATAATSRMYGNGISVDARRELKSGMERLRGWGLNNSESLAYITVGYLRGTLYDASQELRADIYKHVLGNAYAGMLRVESTALARGREKASKLARRGKESLQYLSMLVLKHEMKKFVRDSIRDELMSIEGQDGSMGIGV